MLVGWRSLGVVAAEDRGADAAERADRHHAGHDQADGLAGSIEGRRAAGAVGAGPTGVPPCG